jgi:hypothetical protein
MGEGFAEGVLVAEDNHNEPAATARTIETSARGVYVLSDDERAAIAAASKDGFASDQDVEAFWKRLSLA